jgi:hypothetical protein
VDRRLLVQLNGCASANECLPGYACSDGICQARGDYGSDSAEAPEEETPEEETPEDETPEEETPEEETPEEETPEEETPEEETPEEETPGT